MIAFAAVLLMATVHGTVFLLPDNVPAPGVQVTIGNKTAVTDAKGQYAMRDVPRGETKINATLAGAPKRNLTTCIDGDDSTVNVDLVAHVVDLTTAAARPDAAAPAYTLSSRVIDAVGSPVSGADVEIIDGKNNVIKRVVSRRDGAFSVALAREVRVSLLRAKTDRAEGEIDALDLYPTPPVRIYPRCK